MQEPTLQQRDDEKIVDTYKRADLDSNEIIVKLDVNYDKFANVAIPYGIGFMGDSHGLTNIDYEYKRLAFEKVVNLSDSLPETTSDRSCEVVDDD